MKLCLLVLCAAVMIAGSAGAEEEELVWKIAFEFDQDGDFEIYVMDGDGTNQTNLTNSSGVDWSASLSADGSKISFRPDRDEDRQIYVMKSDALIQQDSRQFRHRQRASIR